MFEINLKKYNPQRQTDNTFLCNVRKRLIPATPEEEVRQAIIKYLIIEKGYTVENVAVEVQMSYFKPQTIGRADILIYDDEQNVLCLIECKEPNEFLSDAVLDQILKYDEIVNAGSLCIAIGGQIHFLLKDGNELLKLTEFPSYKTLIENGRVEYFIHEGIAFEKYVFKLPIPQEQIDLFYEGGIFGENTDKKYLPFLFNLYNFYIDENDKLLSLPYTEDVGLKTTKYGNASGGVFFGDYRAFLYKRKYVISFSISSTTRGDGYPVYTSLMFGVDVKGTFHLSLELRVDKYININNSIIEIIHDGTITIGKLGASKRADLIEFIRKRKPHLIRNDKIFLGNFDLTKEIKGDNKETKDFIWNSIEYALIRDEYREYIKSV